MAQNIYYVYERFRKDNNSCFYVGRGHGNRVDEFHRNDMHDKIANTYGYYSVIYKDGLSAEESCELEKERIRHYVFDLGYGIDIRGYMKDNPDMFLTNRTFGGEDGFFKNGELNPQYGVSPIDRMGSHYDEWFKKNSERCKKQVGELNPNYGNDTLHNIVKDNPELRIKWYSRKDEQNGRAVSIRAFDPDGNEIGVFKTIGKCCQYLKDNYGFKASINGMRSRITVCIKSNKPYKKFRFEYA